MPAVDIEITYHELPESIVALLVWEPGWKVKVLCMNREYKVAPDIIAWAKSKKEVCLLWTDELVSKSDPQRNSPVTTRAAD